MRIIRNKCVSIMLTFVMIILTIPNMGKQKVEAASANDVTSLAISQIGYHEKATNSMLDDFTANSGSGNYTKYARDVAGNPCGEWCAYFVWWIYQTAGVPSDQYPHTGQCDNHKAWFVNRGRYAARGTYIPQPGDVIYFDKNHNNEPDHVAIVEFTNGNNVHFIEGNYSNKVGWQEWPMNSSSILGYGKMILSGSSSDRKPDGFFDSVTSESSGTIRVRGWAYDPDRVTESCKVHVYIGGPAGSANAEGHEITANVYRQDVDNALHIGGFHGFDTTISTNKTGNQPVYVYGIDISQFGNNNELNNSGKYVNIKKTDADVIYPQAVTLLPNTMNLQVGDTAKYELVISPANATKKQLTWNNSNPSVAYINNGVVTALSPGVTTIQCVTENKKASSITVYVSERKIEATSIKLDKDNIHMSLDSTAQINATVYPLGAADDSIEWYSEDPSIATVDGGLVVPKKTGKVVIGAMTGNGITAYCTITIKSAYTKTETYKKNGIDYGAVFDHKYYADKNPDLKRVFGYDKNRLLNHFIQYGMSEGRQAKPSFDVKSYRNKYPDLRLKFGKNYKQYYIHYINYGYKEGRKATGVSKLQNPVARLNGINYSAVYDYNYYIKKNPDVKKKYGDDDVAVLKHFINYGMKEGRKSKSTFNISVYMKQKDLKAKFGNDKKKYYLHYINYGKKEGRKAY